MCEQQEDFCQRILRETREFQARQAEEAKVRQIEAEAHGQKVTQLSAACDMACAIFDHIKAQQSANCVTAAAMAAREIKQYGANPVVQGSAPRGTRSLSGKRGVAAK